MAAKKLRKRMHDDVRTMVDRPQQIGGRQGVIDDQRHSSFAGYSRDRLDVGNATGRVGDRLDEYRLRVRSNGSLETADIVGVSPYHIPAEALEGMGELVD